MYIFRGSYCSETNSWLLKVLIAYRSNKLYHSSERKLKSFFKDDVRNVCRLRKILEKATHFVEDLKDAASFSLNIFKVARMEMQL